MAYFIVIGTNNDVKNVVDEIKTAHLQHNVVTSGCILREGQDMYYHWDVFNEKGDKTKDSEESISLHDALTNQISQFKTLLPADAVTNVFIVSKCFDESECEILLKVCEELYQIGGAMMSGLLVDIVLVGYDINQPSDVTVRPHWRILESLRGLGVVGRFHTNILYLNNMDYMGAATNVDSKLLGRFLCLWSKMVCAGGGNPKSTVVSTVYSIGLSEYQYDFRDLNEFFKLSAEEKLLDRTLNNEPSSDTQELLDYNYYKRIDLELPWIDGLLKIQSLWNSYCSTPWDPSILLSDNVYSVSRQEQELASYLNLYLKLYISEENREIEYLNKNIAQKEAEINALSANLQTNEEVDEPIAEQQRISQLESEIEGCKQKIKIHKKNIINNTFVDTNEFHEKFGVKPRVTEDDEIIYSSNYESIGSLIKYVKSDAGIKVIREAIDRATVEDVLPQPYPADAVFNLGRCRQDVVPSEEVISISVAVESTPEELSQRPGCIGWFLGIFNKNKKTNTDSELSELSLTATELYSRPALISDDISKSLDDALNKTIVALKKVDDVRAWWNKLCGMIEKYQMRMAECKLLMDGEKNLNGQYLQGKEGYRPKYHRKSISLIDMDRVRDFRDTDAYYKQNVDKFLNRWFDKSIKLNQRMTMLELIKHQVLDPLVGRYHTLKWDGTNPFVKENITDDELHGYIEHNIIQSKPFVEYVRIQESNFASNLNIEFFSNNENISNDPIEFRRRYSVSSDSITPVYLKDFVNSLCVVQVMDIPNHIDALKDFKPKREMGLSRMSSDIRMDVLSIVDQAKTIEEKAKVIYDWICDNIAYDTTKQIHDAETCWTTKRGVCQAYSELFCYMAEAVGLTADIIVGKTKNPKGEISTDKHAWVFVYTDGYDGIIIDPTWGAGGVDGVKFVKKGDNSMWFNVSPYWMIFSHFPDNPNWTKLDIDITEEQFKQLPYVNPSNETDGKDTLFESLS